MHVSAYIEQLQARLSAPPVKQDLAALRVLFHWLEVGQVMASNPARSVRGPRHSVRKGKTPVLTARSMRSREFRSDRGDAAKNLDWLCHEPHLLCRSITRNHGKFRLFWY